MILANLDVQAPESAQRGDRFPPNPKWTRYHKSSPTRTGPVNSRTSPKILCDGRYEDDRAGEQEQPQVRFSRIFRR
jgi:hypothetical protein